MTRTMYDAAYAPPDPRLDVVAGYIGGDTLHVWTDAEWASQSARWRLPIYTRSDPAGHDGAAEARSVLAWLQAHRVAPGAAAAVDYETAVDAAYITAFDAVLVGAGYKTVLYGSLSTVTQNPRPSAGYWTASWTGAAHLDAGAAATQWASDFMLGLPYDLSVVSDALVLWDTRPPAPPPAPSTPEGNVYLIEVSPDPSQPGSTGTTGIYAVHEGLGPVHVDGATWGKSAAAMQAQFGAPIPVSTAYYDALLAAAPRLTGTLNLSLTGTGSLTAA